MSIQNQRGITSYPQFMETLLEGQPHADLKADNKVNPSRVQLSNVTVGGTATNGTYTITATDVDDASIVASASVVRAGGVPATNAALAAALVVAINADSSWRNVATAVVNGGVPEQVDLTFLHAGRAWTMGVVAPAPGTLVPATTQTAGGVSLPFGRFLVVDASSQDAVALPTGATAAAIMGVSVRAIADAVNLASGSTAAVDALAVGQMVASGFDGEIAMRNNGSVAAAAHGAVFAVVATAGGDEIGEARSNADGGNTVAMDIDRCYWVDPVPVGAIGMMRLRL